MYFIVKTLITSLVVVIVAELAKRNTVFAALIASLPLTSILALIWLYQDTKDTAKTAALSYEILWLIVPSLLFFIIFPLLIKNGVRFYPALIVAYLAMLCGYGIFVLVKKLF